MHVNLEAAEFMSDILKESRNKTGKFSPFTTWKGTLRVFYLAQSGNRISITTEYLARLFQPTSDSKQLVFRGAARGTLLPWDTRSPSPQYPLPGAGNEATAQPRRGILQDLTPGSIYQRCQKCSPELYNASVCFPLCAGCCYMNPLWVSLWDSW